MLLVNLHSFFEDLQDHQEEMVVQENQEEMAFKEIQVDQEKMAQWEVQAEMVETEKMVHKEPEVTQSSAFVKEVHLSTLSF